MTSILTSIRDRLRNLMNPNPTPSPPPQPWTTHDANLTLHHCLSTPTPTKPALPPELILQILEHPTRLIPVTSIHISAPSPDKPLTCTSQGPQHGDWRILATDPLPAHVLGRVRGLVYSFESRDQGWSSYAGRHGTYDASWTWFEAGVARFEEEEGREEEEEEEEEVRGDSEREKERYELQRNRHAGKEAEAYRIELGRDHELVRRAEGGDRFALWVRAMYPCWVNRVYYARIDVWCVDDLAEA